MSDEWYNTLYLDLWEAENSLYSSISQHVEEAIAIASSPSDFQRLIAILFTIQRLETIIARGKGLQDLEEKICGLAALLAAGGFSLSVEQKSKVLEVLTKNAVPFDFIKRIEAKL